MCRLQIFDNAIEVERQKLKARTRAKQIKDKTRQDSSSKSSKINKSSSSRNSSSLTKGQCVEILDEKMQNWVQGRICAVWPLKDAETKYNMQVDLNRRHASLNNSSLLVRFTLASYLCPLPLSTSALPLLYLCSTSAVSAA